MRAGQVDDGSAGIDRAHFGNVDFQAVAHFEVIRGKLQGTGQAHHAVLGFQGEVARHVVHFEYGGGDEFLFLFLVRPRHVIPLGFAHGLDDHLLSGGGGQATEGVRCHLFFHDGTDLVPLRFGLRVFEGNLANRILDGFDDLALQVDLHIPFDGIQNHAGACGSTDFPFNGFLKSALDFFEHIVHGDAFGAFQLREGFKQFGVHLYFLSFLIYELPLPGDS